MTRIDTAREAAALLWRHRCEGTKLAAMPDRMRPRDAAQGHAVQAELPVVSARAVVGWKIAATSAAGQAHIQVDGPLPGRILEGFVYPVGAGLSLTGNGMRVVEPEFAFRLGADLPPRAAPRTRQEVIAAVASLHPSFEIPDSRFADFTRAGKAQLLADDACCGNFVLAAAAPEAWRQLDLAAHRVHATVTNASTGETRITREGEGRAALGDPRAALVWLVNELSALGLTLAAGQFVSTGTCMVPLEVQPGDRVQADYGVLGRLEVELSD